MSLNPEPERKHRRRAITSFGAVLLCVLGFVLFFRFNFTTVVVSGQSMLPTLKDKQKVLVSTAYWLVGPIQDRDIVVIKGEIQGEYIIKRVFRRAGETVDFLNAPGTWSLTQGEYKVPDGNVYVLGDNRAISEDSRKFGPVETNKIIGKVVAY